MQVVYNQVALADVSHGQVWLRTLYDTKKKKHRQKTAFQVRIQTYVCNGFQTVVTYLEHFLDAFRRGGAILGDIGTEDVVGLWVRLTIFARLVIPQLLEDGLGHVGVEIVDKDVLRHTVWAHFSNQITIQPI